MPTGTFIIKPTAATGLGAILVSGVYPSDYVGWYSPTSSSYLTAMLTNTFLDAVTRTTGAATPAFNDSIRCTCSGASIYLDGSGTPIAYNDLPTGFVALSASLLCHTITRSGAGPFPDFYLQHAVSDESAINTQPPFVYDFSFPAPTMLDLVNDGFGIRVVVPVATLGFPHGITGVNQFRVEGTYEIQSFTWTLQNNSPVSQNSVINVVSSGVNPLDFTTITDITIEFIDENAVPRSITIATFNATVNTLSFVLQLGGYFPQIISISAMGTQFSGSVTLGKLYTIYFINAPGIYRIVKDKTSDTLYDVYNGGTIEVKIPRPFAKLGLVP